MSKLLVINAHPIVDSTSSVSLNVLDYFMSVYKEQHSSDEIVEQINLYSEVVPMIDETVLTAWGKLRNGNELTNQEQQVTERMNEIVKQFKSANKYVIAYPLHNFNVSTKLKAYMDNILIARETFKYTDTGSVGLLKDGRSIVVIQGSGAIYTNNDWYTEVEYSHKYLKSMFNFMGIEDYEIIRVQGTDLLGADRDKILQKGYEEAEKIASELAKK
ncbi:FMN-dependent NADH-azoreductase [Psychrobacillus lasiicapitis]|uniref:FMN dependent NADH:quinone oxidoreductase n=1 Tax=Psychrobacillus lasiicapitis TaxID=1636719 RepID=A0A544TB36_9BACI|nr:NAD(P)H-dependent oxidoreductase [Psychrobacillus lasiicapitis]TQR14588.1 FMN-dependent NADH-azoreductase [Psychrobacillus lasiicapitis]GGA30127.1 FMN-dependent NADH-azoreductase 1 [Psychrobacillus lasiicapitis]